MMGKTADRSNRTRSEEISENGDQKDMEDNTCVRAEKGKES